MESIDQVKVQEVSETYYLLKSSLHVWNREVPDVDEPVDGHVVPTEAYERVSSLRCDDQAGGNGRR